MKNAAEVRVRPVRWRMTRSGAAARLALDERRGALVSLALELDGERVRGLGEASPLPGAPWPDELADIERAFGDALAAGLPGSAAACATLARELAAPWPAFCFALETALLDALAQHRRVPLAALLAPTPAARVPVNAVVASLDEAAAAYARGVRCFKVKLGSDTASDAALLAALRRGWPQVSLRADANRGWPPAEVGERLRALAPAGLEYVEEPCAGLAARLAGGERWPVPVALDESLAELEPELLAEAVRAPDLAALVLKPTALGGLNAALALAELALTAGKRAVTTHALEGPVGTAACAELGRALGGAQPELAVGLDRHPALAAWPVAPPQLAAAAVVAAGFGLGLAQALPQLEALPEVLPAPEAPQAPEAPAAPEALQ